MKAYRMVIEMMLVLDEFDERCCAMERRWMMGRKEEETKQV